ncbi:class I SAM-dependent methyltransferase [Solirubrobacter ginsenosidimutans]|uniref:Class I SAM-dependent methyltransferase n=1 Tax=Solirubrobacter ginsenosidimutans TaxID=490573 RepID=A0A9X3S2T7_9ACTN|nr:class I SAM-dependent methyltransferase [Solirubrobacter ginsenosidimutans]MDA0163874.1 class I SAM-dependent methyltransferase [Solirubrobacter ginsenosidimutans]
MDATFIRRVAAAARRHGPGGLPVAAVRRVAAVVGDRRERALEWSFDRRRGIDTAGVLRDGATPYQPVHPAAFRELVSHVPARDTFVDIGSGRARALILAVEHGFRGAVGVEIDAEHHRTAEANVRRYPTIRLVHGDALRFRFPEGPLTILVYNPFPRSVMEAFVDRIPADAWVIYEAPLDRDLFDARFELVAERTERAGASPRRPRFAIYRTR